MRALLYDVTQLTLRLWLVLYEGIPTCLYAGLFPFYRPEIYFPFRVLGRCFILSCE